MGSPSATCFAANSMLYCSFSSPSMEPQSLLTNPAVYLFFTFSLFSLIFLVYSLTRKFVKPSEGEDELHFEPGDKMRASLSTLKLCLSKISEKTQETQKGNPTRLPESLLVELLRSNSPKWAALFSSLQEGIGVGDGDDQVEGESAGDGGRKKGEEKEGKRKKKRAKKKKQNLSNSGDLESEDRGGQGREGEEEKGALGLKKNKEDLMSRYPFTSSSSATQRKIKQQYYRLVKSHESNGLTMAEVSQFVDCLVDAQNELKQKSEMIQRKFTIAKALLLRADRSSFDRLRQQLNKLELEQKRLEEDASVYDWLQQQLKLSPAYKKMLDTGASKKTKAKTDELTENPDADFTDISFEELLAQEKKDSFWQKHGKRRSPSTSE